MRFKIWNIYVVLGAAALAGQLAVAHFLAFENEPDGMVYSRIATNMLERHIYSADTMPPCTPTLIRLPGYPLFLAGVYKVFGIEKREVVRMVQAVISFGTCALVALLAWLWEPAGEHKRRTTIIAFILAAACPFTAIYSGVMMTETLTIFLCVAMVIAATYAFRSAARGSSAAWWLIAGLLAGGMQLMRPDGGLFAAAVGFTIVGRGLFGPGREAAWGARILHVFKQGALFSCAFILVLAPWVIRNARVFHVIQPLPPRYDFLPGEFVSRGYSHWFGTWADSERYLQPLFYPVSSFYSMEPGQEMDFDQVPAKAFDSEEERARVETLFRQYNHPPGAAGVVADGQGDDDNGNAVLTSGVDDGFEQIARERIARAPMRQYLWLPLKRMVALWFVPHAQYYPFEGELFPLDELESQYQARFWLPVFFLLVCLYTIAGVAGLRVLWKAGGASHPDARHWVCLLALLVVPRMIFLSTVEHTEPRYVVEFFPFLCLLGGMALTRLLPPKKI